MRCSRVSLLSCICHSQTISKIIHCYWLNFFIVTQRISDWHYFWKSKFLYIVNSAGGRFCWNYVTDTLYSNNAEDNVASVAITQIWRLYYNYAGGTFYYSYVDGSFCCIMHVTTVSVGIIQLEALAALMHVMCGWQFLLYLCRWELFLQLCRWYFLHGTFMWYFLL